MFQQKQHWIFHNSLQNEVEYHFDMGIAVRIVCGEIMLIRADALVVRQDKDMKSEGFEASQLLQCKSKAYEKEIASLRGRYLGTGDVRFTSAPESLTNISKVLHVISPAWTTLMKTDMETCIKNVFKVATKNKLETIVMPFFGRGTMLFTCLLFMIRNSLSCIRHVSAQ
jgi:hypothetical protein